MYILAHGALGPYDELIFLGVAVVFLVMMGVSWFQTRMTEYDDDQRRTTSPDALPDVEYSENRFTLD
jgi:cytoskeletal protein RodZ